MITLHDGRTGDMIHRGRTLESAIRTAYGRHAEYRAEHGIANRGMVVKRDGRQESAYHVLGVVTWREAPMA